MAKRARPVLAMIMCVTLLLCACQGKRAERRAEGRDSVYTLEYIQGIAIEQPRKALALLDTAERRGLMGAFDVNDLRGLVYHNGLSRYRTSLYYACKAYNDPEARKRPKRLLSLLSTLADDSQNNGDYAASERYCAEGLRLARQLGNRRYEADMHTTWGVDLMELAREDEALGHFDTAIGILEEETRREPGYASWDGLYYALGMKLNMLWEKDRDEEAYAMRPLVEKALKGIEESKDAPEGLADMRRAETDALFCPIAYATGRKAEGAELYRRLEKNPYASTPDGEYVRIPGLVAAGRYDEALDCIHREKKLLRETTDTVNWDYVNPHLQSELEALQGKGDWREASRVQQEMLTLTDTLRRRERQEDALELSEIYKSGEKDALIKERQAEAGLWRVVSVAALVLLVMAGGFSVVIIREKKEISLHNVALVARIKELLDSKKELDAKIGENLALRDRLEQATGGPGAARPGDGPVPQAGEGGAPREDDGGADEADRVLFERVACEIKEKRLFRDPKFSRADVLRIIPVSQNKFAGLFTRFAGMKFTAYVQDLRLEYAGELFIEHPDWSVDAVIRECGISRAAFYRSFVQKFSIRPEEFRKNARGKS